MTPGPVQPTSEVLSVMGESVQVDYGDDFTQSYYQTLKLLKKVFGTEEDTLVLVGSGSAGIDACIGSALSSGDKILIGVNGFFGERLQEIARGYGLEVLSIYADWGKPLKVSDFEPVVKLHSDIKMIAAVHLETSTAILNPIEELGQFSKKHSIPLLVDAVSSLGGIPIEMDDWGIDFCVSASQKCLGAPPGLSPIAVSSRGWEVITQKTNNCHGWYLNLSIWKKYAEEWKGWHPFPITMATNNFLALKKSVEDLLNDGLAERLKRYTKIAHKLRGGLRDLGMQLFAPDNLMTPLITAVYGPKAKPSSEVIKYLLDKGNIRVAGGLGQLTDKIFRVGHMSPSVTEEDVSILLDWLRKYNAS